MHVRVVTGNEVLQLVASSAFRAQWQRLYQRCPWATAFQHGDFVASWYRLYEADFLPLLVVGDSDADTDAGAVGLLPLAMRRNTRRISGAGDQQAEYQGWLQAPDAGGAFIATALLALRERFPHADLRFNYLPPGTPLDGVRGGACCVTRASARAVMAIDAAAMARQRNKKTHRQNVNRLRRVGEVALTRVVDHDHFARVLDAVCPQYDFRQAALYRSMPFTADPAKKALLIELHRCGLLHTTILTVGEAIAACHIGVLSAGKAVHLSITTYDPAFAPHSPGTLLLAMLGVQLADEGIALLDLTPGGDGYKESFATGHDSVVRLTVYASIWRRLASEALFHARRTVKAVLRRAGVRPVALVAAWQTARRLATPGLPARLRVYLNSCLASRGEGRARTWRRPAHAPAARTHGLPIARNSLHDVLKFDPHGALSGFADFLGTAMRRMERSHSLYSLVQDGTLVLCCWAQAGADDVIVLSDLYVHRRLFSDALVGCFLEQVVATLTAPDAGAHIAYRGKPGTALRAVVERCGFVDDDKTQQHRSTVV
jgi:CelD/BcsL family acetyltransferase involved in cellulose biosynthesis